MSATLTPEPAAAPVTVHDLEAHRSILVAHCRRMLGSSVEAEDAAQEAIVRAWRSLDRFEGRSSVRSWLWRIATNVCLDMSHSPQRRAVPAAEPAGREIGAVSRHVADPGDVVAEADDVRLAVAVAVQRLPPRQRAALVLCDVLQWRAAEAADLMNVTVASVNSALQRARATLAAA
jgi:RNA polymerase sigma-70 factor (ECF subfamily)